MYTHTYYVYMFRRRPAFGASILTQVQDSTNDYGGSTDD